MSILLVTISAITQKWLCGYVGVMGECGCGCGCVCVCVCVLYVCGMWVLWECVCVCVCVCGVEGGRGMEKR